MNRRSIPPVILAALVLAALGPPACAQAVLPRTPDAVVQASPLRRMVWVHSMGCFPLDLKWLPAGYGQCAPLEQEAGLEARTGKGWAATDIQDAKDAGIDGFSVDVFDGDTRSYLEQADAVGGFLIAPCLDLSTTADDHREAAAVQIIERNCRVAAGHPSAARVGGADMVFLYGTGMLAPEAWGRVRARLKADGFPTYLVAAVEAGGDLSVASQFPREVMARYLPLFEAAYSFGSTGTWWNETRTLVRAGGKLWAGGMMPGYDRETANGGYSDARATAAYREEWHRHLAGKTSPVWACISTWNDLAENTELLPSSDWNVTRAELTRWFSAKFKGQSVGWAGPHLYVTTPKAVYRNKLFPMEGLALNTLPRTVRVTTEMQDGAGRRIGSPETVLVASGEDGAATLRVRQAAFPAGRFLRARATLRDGSRVIATVLSAPILVLDEASQPGYRQTYYSVPAHKALPGAVRLSVAAGRGRGTRLACVLPPHASTVRFAEILHNAALVRNFFRDPSPLALPQSAEDGSVAGRTAWGFTVGRVTDDKFRVGYSDAVYAAPQGDVSLWEKFDFDEGRGQSAQDSSIYGKVGRLQNAAWAAPGADGSPACLRFNGSDSRVLLDGCPTPTGPFSLTLTVRPAWLGGFLYGDGGGLICELRPDGRLNFSLLTAQGWRPVVSRTALKLGEWARLEFSNDGARSRIRVNGRLDAEAASGPLNDSGTAMIGGNPYGGDAYAGDLDDFVLRTL